jgi:transposase
MISHALAVNVPFSWVAADSVYGVGDIEMALRHAGKGYVLGVSANRHFGSWRGKPPVAGAAEEIAQGLASTALPGREGHVGGNAADNRLFFEAILYRYRTGIPWRDLPARFGDWKIVHQRFSRWAKSGVFERIFKPLASDHDNEYMMIDATIVRAHQHSAGARKKRPASDRPIARWTSGNRSNLPQPLKFGLTSVELIGGLDPCPLTAGILRFYSWRTFYGVQ